MHSIQPTVTLILTVNEGCNIRGRLTENKGSAGEVLKLEY
jgi:hypothetical protein